MSVLKKSGKPGVTDLAENLKGKTALVTGGAGGIGLAVSLLLAREGAFVIILGRDEYKGQKALESIKKIGGKASFYSVDLMAPVSVKDSVESFFKRGLRVDILVNNAGVSGFMGPVVNTPVDELRDILRVNLEAPFQLSSLVLPGMIERGYGRIVNISSVAARVNPPNSVSYNISKAGLNSFTKSLSREVASHGITVNALAPGLVLTERIKKNRLPGLSRETGISPDDLLEGMKAKTDTRKLTSEDEIAQAVLFLCSKGADNISGEVIEMSGGY